MNQHCPDPGQLRAWLDGEHEAVAPLPADGAPTGLSDHLAACHACSLTLAALREDADAVGAALTALGAEPPSPNDTERALIRLRARLAAEQAPVLAHEGPAALRGSIVGDERSLDGLPAGASDAPSDTAALPARQRNHADDADPATPPRRRSMPITLHWQRWRLALAGLAAALSLVLALATPEGRTAGAAFLAQFRSQKLQIVTLNPDQTRQRDLFRLERVATVRNGQQSRPIEVASVQEAASRAGFPVLQPDLSALPPGVSRTPKVRVSPANEVRITFDRQKTRDYLDSMNRKDLSLPDKLHNSTLVVSMPAVVFLEYPSADGKPGLMVGEAREVQVGVEGAANLEEVRSFLLDLPGLPADLTRQLASIQDWRNTLPIPIPVDRVAWQDTTISGAPAIIVNDNTGIGSGVIWQRDGRILGVAGPMKATDARRIAESMR